MYVRCKLLKLTPVYTYNNMHDVKRNDKKKLFNI